MLTDSFYLRSEAAGSALGDMAGRGHCALSLCVVPLSFLVLPLLTFLPRPIFHVPSRRRIIEARLAELERADLKEEIFRAWDAHLGEACMGVSWSLLDRESLGSVTACIGATGWATRLLARCGSCGSKTNVPG